MKQLMQELRENSIKAIVDCGSAEELEALRVKYLGKKGELTGILRQMGKLSAEERPVMGQLANELREDIENALEKRKEELSAVMLEKKLKDEELDVTLPGEKKALGHKHPMYNVLDQIKDIFIGMGFEIVDGPEVETDYYNFEALNNNDPVIIQEKGKKCVRDPYIFKGQDNCYYIIGTDMNALEGWTSNHALVTWKSEDLINWTDERIIDFSQFDSTKNANRVWAPEVVFDKEKGEYMIYWTHNNADDDLDTLAPSLLADQLTQVHTGLKADGGNTLHFANSVCNNGGDHIFRNHHIAIILSLGDVLLILCHGNTS